MAFGRDGHSYRFTTPLSNELDKPQFASFDDGSFQVLAPLVVVVVVVNEYILLNSRF